MKARQHLIENSLIDLLQGGLGDKANIGDYCYCQIVAGIAVEREHSDNAQIALEVALDHLTEDPYYYSNVIPYDEVEASLNKVLDKIKADKNKPEEEKSDEEDEDESEEDENEDGEEEDSEEDEEDESDDEEDEDEDEDAKDDVEESVLWVRNSRKLNEHIGISGIGAEGNSMAFHSGQPSSFKPAVSGTKADDFGKKAKKKRKKNKKSR